MKEFCVGLALMWVIAMIKGQFRIKGLFGFILAGMISYGLGYVVCDLIFKR